MDLFRNFKGAITYLFTFVLKSGVLTLNFIAAIFLTNIIGLSGFGEYAVAMAWVSISSALSRLGTDLSAVRFCSVYVQEQDWSMLRCYLSWALTTVAVMAFGLASLVIMAAFFLSDHLEDDLFFTIVAAAVIVPPLSLLQSSSGVLRGTGSLVQAQLGEIVRLSSHLIIIFSLYMLKLSMAVHVILLGMAAAAFMSLLMNFYFISRRLKGVSASGWVKEQSLIKSWWKSSIAFSLVSVVNLLNQRVGIIFVGYLLTGEAAGVYTIARRVTDIMKIIPTTAVFVLGPRFARLFNSDDQHLVAKLGSQIARVTCAMLLVVMILLVFFGDSVLSIFDGGAAVGQSALLIFAFTHVVSSAFGPVALALNMSANESRTALGMGISVIVQALLCVLFAPTFGLEGAAVAYMISVIFWNIHLSQMLYSTKKIFVSVL